MILASATATSVALSVATALAYSVPALGGSRIGPRPKAGLIVLAWLLHAAVLALGLFGDQAFFGFAPALSGTAWLVAAVYGLESYFYPGLQTRWGLSALGAVAVLMAMVFPGAPLHTNASPWLAMHWALGIASYGLFGAAAVHAWLMLRAEAHMRHGQDPHSGMPLLTIERLTFRFVAAGFVLLTATLVVGWLFTEALYGQGVTWKWNHKTVFSLLSWVTFAVLLLGRWRFGWRGRPAVRMLYAGSVLLLLAYVGSRFVLEVVLGRTP